jgi:hypothetical protein
MRWGRRCRQIVRLVVASPKEPFGEGHSNMPGKFPRLFADDKGVWREDKPGHPFGIEWEEIVGVGEYNLDGVTEAFTVVELDYPNGHFIELNSDWSGFAQVIDAMSSNLPGNQASWFSAISTLDVSASSIRVWHRA